MNLACVSAHLHRWKAACAACIMVLAITAAPVARATTIFTEEDPPFSFEGPEGTPIGYGVAVVQSIQKVMGTQDPITMVPWARAYKTILTQPNVAIVTMSRTRARETLFHWVGPIIENQWVIVAKKSAKLRMETLDDAKKIKAIGVVRDYAWADYLKARGFKNLEPVADYSKNVRKLNLGRIDAMVAADLSFRSQFRQNGIDPTEFEVVYGFERVQMYIALSETTDKATVERWQAAFAQIKKEGTLAKVLTEWLPQAVLPEAATAPTF